MSNLINENWEKEFWAEMNKDRSYAEHIPDIYDTFQYLRDNVINRLLAATRATPSMQKAIEFLKWAAKSGYQFYHNNSHDEPVFHHKSERHKRFDTISHFYAEELYNIFSDENQAPGREFSLDEMRKAFEAGFKVKYKGILAKKVEIEDQFNLFLNTIGSDTTQSSDAIGLLNLGDEKKEE